MENSSPTFVITKRRLLGAILAMSLIVVFGAPQIGLVSRFVTFTIIIGSLAVIIFGLTFRRDARIQIGRLKYRYRVVRRNAGVVALVGFSFFIVQQLSFALWSKAPVSNPEDTPHFIANKLKILAELKARQFGTLDKQLRSYQADAERNIAWEDNADFAFDAFDNANRSLGSLIDEWESKMPDSYVPHLAKAEYLFACGWRARGTKWSSETSDQQIAQMNEYFTKGAVEISVALRTDQKLTEAYELLIDKARATEGQEAAFK